MPSVDREPQQDLDLVKRPHPHLLKGDSQLRLSGGLLEPSLLGAVSQSS